MGYRFGLIELEHKPWFNGKRDERMEKAAKLLAQNDENTMKIFNKLKMACGPIGEYRTIVEFPNGVKIMEFYFDGLIDTEVDWELGYLDYLDTDEELLPDKVYRVYGVSEELWRKNFMTCVKTDYGLYELTRELSIYMEDDFTYLNEDDGPLRNSCTHPVLIIGKNGEVVLDKSDTTFELYDTPAGCQFSTDYNWYRDAMIEMHTPIIEYIRKNGPEYDLENNKYTEISAISNRAVIGDRYTHIDCKNIDSECQLIHIGIYEDVYSFIMLDLKTGKEIDSGIAVKKCGM